jgi:hypothetical protein
MPAREILVNFLNPLLSEMVSLSSLLLTVKFRQPSHEFTFGVGMSFICYPLVQTPLI